MQHETVEKNLRLMSILIVVVISIGGLVEIIPLMAQTSSEGPSEGIVPYPALQLAGRDVYIREGCYGCHSQQVRPFRSETERYGPYSIAGEAVYDRPFQFGSKRTGPAASHSGKCKKGPWRRTRPKRAPATASVRGHNSSYMIDTPTQAVAPVGSNGGDTSTKSQPTISSPDNRRHICCAW